MAMLIPEIIGALGLGAETAAGAEAVAGGEAAASSGLGNIIGKVGKFVNPVSGIQNVVDRASHFVTGSAEGKSDLNLGKIY